MGDGPQQNEATVLIKRVLLQKIDPPSRAYRWYSLTLETDGDLFKTPYVIISRGRIGQNGEVIKRPFSTPELASEYFNQKVQQRLKHGYAQVETLDALFEPECTLCDLLRHKDAEVRTIFEFANSILFLNRDQTYRGRSMLVFKRHIPDFFRLAPSELLSSLREIRASEEALRNAFDPILMNYLFMGNRAGHVHLHLVPRYANDPKFGDSPFLDTYRTLTAQLSEGEYKLLADTVRTCLARQL